MEGIGRVESGTETEQLPRGHEGHRVLKIWLLAFLFIYPEKTYSSIF